MLILPRSDNSYANPLSAPRALRAATPADWPAGKHSKLLIACDLDPDGMLRNARILKSDDSVAAQSMLAALSGWKFALAFRGDQPVKVTAILGSGWTPTRNGLGMKDQVPETDAHVMQPMVGQTGGDG